MRSTSSFDFLALLSVMRALFLDGSGCQALQESEAPGKAAMRGLG
jgi:hypothetical protein